MEKFEEDSNKPPIDMVAFQEILDLGEDDESFTKTMIQTYYSQADETLEEMKKALARKDLAQLFSLAYFLKDSSITLGVTKVQATCWTIHINSQLKEDDRSGVLDKDEAVKRIGLLVERVGGEIDEAKKWFNKFYPIYVPVDD
ncbi:hypothetical protein FRB94_005202 [Tulasnella sp. JGI-2019a]|nr:hypothetical protein FRB93_013791 [Tulasnella sp. JGI-2019a]KAG9000695.1 hypothetical protein FRB94_005202 [Tulasnella sp. JGI-2019a]